MKPARMTQDQNKADQDRTFNLFSLIRVIRGL